MSYEEGRLACPHCRRETWHGRDAADVFRARSLTVVSHAMTLYQRVFVPWRCLECGRPTRGRADPGPYVPPPAAGPAPGENP